MAEIYVSTDVEADGPIPGPHSMLSFGSAAFDAEGNQLSTFSANLVALIKTDQRIDLLEWVLHRLLIKELRPHLEGHQSRRARHGRLQQLLPRDAEQARDHAARVCSSRARASARTMATNASSVTPS